MHNTVADWLVKQLDINYDIPTSPLDDSKSSSSKGSLSTLRLFDGCINVKHLDRVYHVYNKQLPDKGRKCIHIEEQIYFPSDSPAPTLSSLPNTVMSSPTENIIDIVIPSDSLSYQP